MVEPLWWSRRGGGIEAEMADMAEMAEMAERGVGGGVEANAEVRQVRRLICLTSWRMEW